MYYEDNKTGDMIQSGWAEKRAKGENNALDELFRVCFF